MSSVNPTEATPLLQAEYNDGVLVFQKEAKRSREIFWEELGLLPRYVLPVLGSQVLEYSMVVTNVISVGHLSTTALAAVSLGSMTAGVTGFSMLHGLASGLETILPAAYTSPNPQLVGLWTQRMAVVMACALVPVCLIWHNAEPIFLALRQDPELYQLRHGTSLAGESHFSSLFELRLTMPYSRYFQSQRLFSVQTNIMILVAPLNALGNYALVWGPESIRLGFIGAPIATMVSYYLVAIASFVYGAYLIPRTAWHPLSMKMFCDLGILVRLGLSGVAQVTSQWWAWEFATLATSYMGPISLAGHSILSTTSAMIFQLHFSNVSAATIRIGNLLGENNAVRARIASRAGLAIALICAMFTCSGLLLVRKSWPKLFNEDPAVVILVSQVLPIIAMYQCIDATAAMGAGFLRVRGMQVCHWDYGSLSSVNSAFTAYVLWSRTDWKEEVLKVAERNSREERRQKALKMQDEESRI
ncbi:hypothetical protein DXG01_009352 [Tephrocybe rancida]|nr:hypothetical protein DXG01_009352 [Tephrocybe rancida]